MSPNYRLEIKPCRAEFAPTVRFGLYVKHIPSGKYVKRGEPIIMADSIERIMNTKGLRK
jgi:hypothetical protein